MTLFKTQHVQKLPDESCRLCGMETNLGLSVPIALIPFSKYVFIAKLSLQYNTM